MKKIIIIIALVICSLFIIGIFLNSLTGFALSGSSSKKESISLSQSEPTGYLTCHDSDNGINLRKKGKFIDASNSEVWDECSNTAILLETFCNPDCNCKRIPISCQSSTECSDGTCIINNFQTYEDMDTSLDFQREPNIYVKGKLRMNNNLLGEDSCVDSNTVREYSIPGAFAFTDIKCPLGTTCNNGKCSGAEVNCNSIISGHNDPFARRINLVFVGVNYNDVYPNDLNLALNTFIKDSKYALGIYDDKNNGFFSKEPYKSNMDKFNLWYVNKLVDANPMTVSELDQKMIDLQNNAIGAASICSLTHKVVVAVNANSPGKISFSLGIPVINLMTHRNTPSTDPIYTQYTQEIIPNCYDALITGRTNNGWPQHQTDGSPFIDINNDNCIDYKEIIDYGFDFEDTSSPTYCMDIAYTFGVCKDMSPEKIQDIAQIDSGLENDLAHEFAHYLSFVDVHKPLTTDVPVIESSVYVGPNTFAASSVDECLQNAPWSWLVGNGCGQDGIIDCTSDDTRYNLEVGCSPGGTLNVKSYRASSSGIMPYVSAISGIPGNLMSSEFNLWEQYYLNSQLKAVLDVGIWPTTLDIPIKNWKPIKLSNSLLKIKKAFSYKGTS